MVPGQGPGLELGSRQGAACRKAGLAGGALFGAPDSRVAAACPGQAPEAPTAGVAAPPGRAFFAVGSPGSRASSSPTYGHLHESALHLGNDRRGGPGILDVPGLVAGGETLRGTQTSVALLSSLERTEAWPLVSGSGTPGYPGSGQTGRRQHTGPSSAHPSYRRTELVDIHGVVGSGLGTTMEGGAAEGQWSYRPG